jgi:hypothetical protein
VARSRVRCCPSSLYTFTPAVGPERLARDCLLPVSPNLGSSAPWVSPGALKSLKSLASTNFATPAVAPNLTIKVPAANGKAQTRDSVRNLSRFRAVLGPPLGANRVAVGMRRERRTLMTEASTMFLMWEA